MSVRNVRVFTGPQLKPIAGCEDIICTGEYVDIEANMVALALAGGFCRAKAGSIVEAAPGSTVIAESGSIVYQYPGANVIDEPGAEVFLSEGEPLGFSEAPRIQPVSDGECETFGGADAQSDSQGLSGLQFSPGYILWGSNPPKLVRTALEVHQMFAPARKFACHSVVAVSKWGIGRVEERISRTR